jgi:uncharacterized protein (DUF2164 family)
MGFMDKAKEAALQAKTQAQHLAQQGQQKVSTIQEARSVGELYRTLGEAYYNQTRRGGDAQAVTTALEALDQHFAGAATPASESSAPVAPSAEGAAPQTPPASGSFTLDNM